MKIIVSYCPNCLVSCIETGTSSTTSTMHEGSQRSKVQKNLGGLFRPTCVLHRGPHANPSNQSKRKYDEKRIPSFHAYLATCKCCFMLLFAKFAGLSRWLSLFFLCAAWSQYLPRPGRRSHFLWGERRSEWHPEQVRELLKHTLHTVCSQTSSVYNSSCCSCGPT